MYSGGLNTKYLDSELVQNLNVLMFRFWMVKFKNGIKDGNFLVGFGMVELFGFGMPFIMTSRLPCFAGELSKKKQTLTTQRERERENRLYMHHKKPMQ